MIARTAPAVLKLLADGVPRSKRAIIAALVTRHPKDDIMHTLMRLSVTGQLVDVARKYTLAPAAEPDQG
jgi:hypothetical protein